MLDDSSGLVIDRDVRNWVLIPLTVSVLLLLLLRQYASVILTGQSGGGDAQDENDVKQKAILDRCRVMKASSGLLTPSGFHQRIRYFTDQVLNCNNLSSICIQWGAILFRIDDTDK